VAKRLAWVLFSFCPLLAGAQENVSDSVLACSAFKQDNERLICYDRLAERLAKGSTAAAIAPEELFGITAARQPVAERTALEAITQPVTAIRGTSNEVTVTLENGQVWQQIDGKDLLLKVGDEVRISRAALGTFRISTPNNRSARVKRLH
jgi:hypothetical protein